MTSVPSTIKAEWEESVNIAQAADRAGIEAMIPVARWRGMGGEVNFNHRNFDPFTWAAGLAAVTERIGIFRPSTYPLCTPCAPPKKSPPLITYLAADFA